MGDTEVQGTIKHVNGVCVCVGTNIDVTKGIHGRRDEKKETNIDCNVEYDAKRVHFDHSKEERD